MNAIAKDLSTDKVFLLSYRRIASLQGWRSFLDGRISDPCLSFFLEAQNDALVSHVLANLGSWRSSLKSLRGCIENILFSLYYKDHPIEYILWEKGQHKPPIYEFIKYFENHPLRIMDPSIDALPSIKNEYSILSRAVHSSAKSFRMTKDAKRTLLWSNSPESLGRWQTREASILLNLNLLLLAIFRDNLTGTAAKSLREAVSFAIPESYYPAIKDKLSITLRKP
jgi:hypothetical protein